MSLTPIDLTLDSVNVSQSTEAQDWLVDGQGECNSLAGSKLAPWGDRPYRLYRFLTDLEDVLERSQDDRQRLQAICPLVRQLLTVSDWLQGEYLPPDPKTGWSVLRLYDEPDFPLTVQMVTWLPGQTSPIHNHACWGVVAIVSGQEKNYFWRRAKADLSGQQIEAVGDRVLLPGDIISFLPDAIHQIEVLGDEPVVSFNLYGQTSYSQRYEFDPVNHTAKRF